MNTGCSNVCLRINLNKYIFLIISNIQLKIETNRLFHKLCNIVIAMRYAQLKWTHQTI